MVVTIITCLYNVAVTSKNLWLHTTPSHSIIAFLLKLIYYVPFYVVVLCVAKKGEIIMNIINTYGYAVFKGMNRTPLHIVAIYSEVHIAFNVFSCSRDAKDYITDNCGNVKYNPEFDFISDFGDLLKMYTTTEPKYFFKGTNKQYYISTERKA